MAEIDLNARRAARREASGEALVVRIGDERLEMPTELPLAVIDELEGLAGDVDAEQLDEAADREAVESLNRATRALFGEDGWRRFTGAGASLDDLLETVEAVLEHYGVSMAKASASAGSSVSGGASSRPISPGSTASTSETPTDTTTEGAPV